MKQLVGFLVCVAPLLTCRGQAPTLVDVDPGSRLRVTVSGPTTQHNADPSVPTGLSGWNVISGTFDHVTSDSLILIVERQTERIPVDVVSNVQVRLGSTSKWKTGALIGGAFGLAFAGWCYAWCGLEENRDRYYPAFGLISVAIPAAIGAAIGATFRTDSWSDVSLEGFTRPDNQPPETLDELVQSGVHSEPRFRTGPIDLDSRPETISDSLLLMAGGRSWNVPIDRAPQVQVGLRGSGTYKGTGALLGALGGAVAGTILSLTAENEGVIAALLPVGALLGSGVGASIGSAFRTTRWYDLSLSDGQFELADPGALRAGSWETPYTLHASLAPWIGGIPIPPYNQRTASGTTGGFGALLHARFARRAAIELGYARSFQYETLVENSYQTNHFQQVVLGRFSATHRFQSFSYNFIWIAIPQGRLHLLTGVGVELVQLKSDHLDQVPECAVDYTCDPYGEPPNINDSYAELTYQTSNTLFPLDLIAGVEYSLSRFATLNARADVAIYSEEGQGFSGPAFQVGVNIRLQ